MECTSTAVWAHNQPAAVRPLLSKDFEQIVPKTSGRPVGGIFDILADCNPHFLRKGAVEEVKRAFIVAVVHVFYVGL